MATPPRLNEMRCPRCSRFHWIFDCDSRGAVLAGGTELLYSQREYECHSCGFRGAGFQVRRQSPPEFVLQPHQMYPMSVEAFALWVRVVKRHVPDSPLLKELGGRWRAAGPAFGLLNTCIVWLRFELSRFVTLHSD